MIKRQLFLKIIFFQMMTGQQINTQNISNLLQNAWSNLQQNSQQNPNLSTNYAQNQSLNISYYPQNTNQPYYQNNQTNLNALLQNFGYQMPFQQQQTGFNYGLSQQQNQGFQNTQINPNQQFNYSNLLNQLTGQFSNSSFMNNNNLTTITQLLNPQGQSQNIFQQLGLFQNNQPTTTLANFVTSNDITPNAPSLYDTLYPQQFNLYGRPSYNNPTVAEELTAVAVKSLINFATPKWAQQQFRNDENSLNNLKYAQTINLEDQLLDQNSLGNGLQNDSRGPIKNQQVKFDTSSKNIRISKQTVGSNKLADYLTLLDNFDNNSFSKRRNQSVSNCEILQLISPIDQKEQNLQQCLPMHVYANRITQQICFIFSCQNFNRQVYFYQICADIVPLDLENLNLSKKINKVRNFQKSQDPYDFMKVTEFSLRNSIDCNNPKDILKDRSLIEALDVYF